MIKGLLSFIFDNPIISLLGVGTLAMGGVIAYQSMVIQDQREKIINQEFRIDSTEAVADSTRKVAERRINELSDAFRANFDYVEGKVITWQRRAVQRKIERDKLDERLEQVTKAKADLSIRVDSLKTVIDSIQVHEDSAGVRTFRAEVDSLPYSGTITGTVPPPPQLASITLHLTIQDIPVEVRISCKEPPNDREVFRAVVNIQAPDWAPVKIGQPYTSKEVCNAKIVKNKKTLMEKIDAPAAGILGVILGIILL